MRIASVAAVLLPGDVWMALATPLLLYTCGLLLLLLPVTLCADAINPSPVNTNTRNPGTMETSTALRRRKDWGMERIS